jgi:hypothetical protein
MGDAARWEARSVRGRGTKAVVNRVGSGMIVGKKIDYEDDARREFKAHRG